MITMMPSTTCSPSMVTAPLTPVLVGVATGSRVIAYPSSAAEAEMASSVRTLPVVARVNRTTPSVRNFPLFRARAALLGR